jgi:DNA-binding Lrp family transcriptional regulator
MIYGLSMENMTLDKIDFEILSILQNNAQEANKTIAAKVNLAPSTCHERIKRLGTIGVIQGHHTKINPKLYGVALEALFFIKLEKLSREEVKAFLENIIKLNEVRTAYLLAGRFDVIVHVWVKDIEHLQNLALNEFTSRENIASFETSVIFECLSAHHLSPF